MSRVSVLGVSVLENPSPFGRPLRCKVQFECGEALPHDLEWKIICVGSAESEEYDQAEAPNPSLIPESDAVGVTVVLITCTYLGQEFIRVGYYVNNEYTDPELPEDPPLKPDFSQLQRNILASNPRVTRFHINWDGPSDQMEDIENVDPEPEGVLSASCTSAKGPGTALGILPENSMDCM